MKRQKADILSVEKLLGMDLHIPSYQRPYKWGNQNVEDLLFDITNAISDAERHRDNFKYRVGTIILHKSEERVKAYDIVDGQQRIISLILIKKYLDEAFDCSLLNESFPNKITQSNINKNYHFIRDWFALKDDAFKMKILNAYKEILEVVIITVDKVSEAFQLFDSQNTRGKALDPHDLLKAYHLREMKEYPYEMKHAVMKWEAKDTSEIRNLFALYLFPIWNWSRGNKSKPFTAKEIDTYKGVKEGSAYTYAKRASKASPYYQITEPFIAGNDFFEMVEHYLELLNDVQTEIKTNPKFQILAELLSERKNDKGYEYSKSAGYRYTKNLFYCALLCYYDKFHNFDEMAVKKLFTWAFMIRIDMENLGFETINKYAIGEGSDRYSNKIAMFSKIGFARLHTEIANQRIIVQRDSDCATHEKWNDLYRDIKEINGLVKNE